MHQFVGGSIGRAVGTYLVSTTLFLPISSEKFKGDKTGECTFEITTKERRRRTWYRVLKILYFEGVCKPVGAIRLRRNRLLCNVAVNTRNHRDNDDRRGGVAGREPLASGEFSNFKAARSALHKCLHGEERSEISGSSDVSIDSRARLGIADIRAREARPSLRASAKRKRMDGHATPSKDGDYHRYCPIIIVIDVDIAPRNATRAAPRAESRLERGCNSATISSLPPPRGAPRHGIAPGIAFSRVPRAGLGIWSIILFIIEKNVELEFLRLDEWFESSRVADVSLLWGVSDEVLECVYEDFLRIFRVTCVNVLGGSCGWMKFIRIDCYEYLEGHLFIWDEFWF